MKMKMGVNFFLNTIYNACASSIDNFLNVIFIFMTLIKTLINSSHNCLVDTTII